MSAACFAQGFPSRPIKLIVPYAPSGLPDILARTVAQKVADSVGQQIVIDNRPGASSTIGMQLAAKAAPDGYTLVLTDNNSYAINPAVYPKLSYDPSRDFAPVTQALRGPLFLVANAAAGIGSVQDLIALAKARPGVNYGSPGNATIHHLTMEQLKLLAKIDLTHVPYKGVIQATPALLSGEVSAMFVTLPTVLPHAKTGKLRILAVASAQRSSLMPEIATVAEAGFPGFDVDVSMGFAAPAGTPRPVIERLHAEFVKALRLPDIRARIQTFGLEVVAGTPEQFAERMRKDQEHYARLVPAIGLKVD